MIAKKKFDVIIIGGGQSGLAVGYYLRRTNLSFLILDSEEMPGGSWQHTWQSLRLFSPAQWSSLPGVMMNGGGDYYPTRDEAINYIRSYEEKYTLPVRRPVQVKSVVRKGEMYSVHTSAGLYEAAAVVCATGSFQNPFIPEIKDRDLFGGRILHSSQYFTPDGFKGKRVIVVGEGNSGAQILAEVSTVSDTLWVTQKEPRYLPDNVDGRYLFDAATQMYEAKMLGKSYQPLSLGDVVMVPSVKAARERGALQKSVRSFDRFTSTGVAWSNGKEEKADVVIFCTGFKASLLFLEPLAILTADGRVETEETKATRMDGLWLVGYGNWTGFASATLIGVGRSAKRTVDEIVQNLGT